MIKECAVLMTNDYVTVVKFGDTKVQLPSIKKDVKIIRVAYENGKYFVVNEDYKATRVRNEKNFKKPSCGNKPKANSHIEALEEKAEDVKI